MHRAILWKLGVLCTAILVWGVPAQGQVIASGQFELREGIQFKQFTFHHTIPAGLGSTAGRQMAIRLRDLTDPDRTCDADHPLSGCATVDYSLELTGQIFRNLVAVQTTAGPAELHLRLDDTLSSQPEPARPE